MADYVVRMTGQDNLSGTIKQVKSELNDLGKTTSKLDQIDAKFSKITNSTAPLKKQLRDLKTLMAQMNMDGLANTEQYTKIAQEAGKIKDAMDDAAAATKRFSSDTAKLDAGIQALQGIVAVGGVATGVMAMFGVENEKVQQAILKVQGALTVLNGVQQVSNVLNKDSALIQTLKAARMKMATAAQVSQTAATKAGTLAQIKLNLAVLANPYVAAAAAIAALAAGIIYWVSTMDDATEAEEGLNEATKASEEAAKSGYEAYTKNRLELDQLKTTLDNFNGSKRREEELVDELNNKYGNTLGKYKDLASWKKALANVSEYQCKLMQAEAKLAALNAEAYSAWAKAIAGEDFEKNMAKFNKLKEEAAKALDDVNFYKSQVSIAIDLSGGNRGSGSKGSGRGTRTTRTGGSGSGSSTKEELTDLQKLKNERDGYKKQLEDENLTLEKQTELYNKIAALDVQIQNWEAQTNNELEKRVNLLKMIEEAKKSDSYGKGVNPDNLKPSAMTIVPQIDPDALNASMSNMMKGIQEHQQEVNEALGNMFSEELKTKIEDTKDLFGSLSGSVSSLGSIFKAVGADGAAAVMGILSTVLQAATQLLPLILVTTVAKKKEALAAGVASAAAIPYPANIPAIANITSVILATFASIGNIIGSFANGGIISGGSSYGDQILARVNAGEMVLNRKQQSNLFRAIESGNIGAGQTVLVPEFKIKGSDLYGTLRNFSKSVGKTGKVTGIR